MDIKATIHEMAISKYGSQTAFAKAISLGDTTVSAFFQKGELMKTSIITLMKICHGVGISIDGVTRDVIEPYPSGVSISLADKELLDNFHNVDAKTQEIVQGVLKSQRGALAIAAGEKVG